MPSASLHVKYGFDDGLLREWLDLVVKLLRPYDGRVPIRGEAGIREGDIRAEKDVLWERTRVKKLADCEGGLQRFVYRYRLTSEETLLVVALLYGQLEEAVGGTFRLHLEALFEDTNNAFSLLRFLRFFDNESTLVKWDLISSPGIRGRAPTLSRKGFAQLLGYELKSGDKQTKGPSTPAKFLCDNYAPRVRLTDVVLTAETREQIEDALFFVQHRDAILNDTGLIDRMEKGTGLALLFHGPPGTGKTMTAEAFADELGKEVSIVRPEAVESKFVGETEKNIALLFEVARKEELVLVFDECDSFFHTRPTGHLYQNVFVGRQVNMLLRGIEEGEGVYILTTNRADTLDPALERRLAAKVHFPLPDMETRFELWRRMLPQDHGLSDAEISDLAEEYQLTGGQIKQIILSPVRRAARLDRKTSRHDIEAAINGVETKNVRIGF